MAHKLMREALAAVAGLALAGAAPALAADESSKSQSSAAQQSSGASSQGGMAGSRGDTGSSDKKATPEMKKTFAKIHMANAMEIEASRLAKERAQDEKVKEFAEKMAKDHEEADEKVTKLAEEHGVSLAEPAATDEQHKKHLAALDKLRNAQGAQFDRAYVSMMAKDHQKVLSELKTAQKSAKNEDLKKLLDELVPKIEEHARMAQELSSSMGAAGQARRPPAQGTSGSEGGTRGSSSSGGSPQGGSLTSPGSGSSGSSSTTDVPSGSGAGQSGDSGPSSPKGTGGGSK